jgi:hypothetical protein
LKESLKRVKIDRQKAIIKVDEKEISDVNEIGKTIG